MISNKVYSAFHGQQAIKDKYIQRMKDHIAADELVHRVGFENGKGCAVGCTLNAYDHAAYPTELGIPEWIGYVEDRLFEGMNVAKSRTFPLLFLEYINVGSNLELVKAPFIIYMLEFALTRFNNDEYPDIVKRVYDVINLYKFNEQDEAKWRAAVNTAWAAISRASGAASWASGWAAAGAAWAASSAARGADWAAAKVADWASGWAAANAGREADWAAGAASYDLFADKLIELIKECK